MSTVYWSKTDNRKEFVEKVLKIFEPQIDEAQTFLIKPNLVSSEPYPTTTHPEVLDAVLDFLSGKDVVVADAPAVDAGSSKRIVRKSVLKEVCDSRGVPFINLYESKARKFISPRGYKFHMHTLPLEKNFVISLPVLKTHNQCQISGALKNQFGYLPRRERVFMHLGLKNIHQGIAELNALAKPDLFIIDAVKTLITAQEVRHGGKEKELGYMLAGIDPLALDFYGFELLQKVEPKLKGKSPEDILHLKYSLDYQVGSKDFETTEISV